jgi:hypothetical protein
LISFHPNQFKRTNPNCILFQTLFNLSIPTVQYFSIIFFKTLKPCINFYLRTNNQNFMIVLPCVAIITILYYISYNRTLDILKPFADMFINENLFFYLFASTWMSIDCLTYNWRNKSNIESLINCLQLFT